MEDSVKKFIILILAGTSGAIAIRSLIALYDYFVNQIQIPYSPAALSLQVAACGLQVIFLAVWCFDYVLKKEKEPSVTILKETSGE